MTSGAFDGHNDVLYKLWVAGGASAAEGFVTGLPGHLDLPKAHKGDFIGGFFAVFVPSPMDDSMFELMKQPSYDLPLPEPLDRDSAAVIAEAQMATLERMDALGAVRICKSATEIDAAIAAGKIAALMHMEGAEAIDAELEALDGYYARGLRSLGPVWSRPTTFAHGVPFRYPSGPDIGPGLTEAGVRLVQRCAELGVVIDLSHLNEAGFWDIARATDTPLVATHSNAYALCPHARNLTDKQLDAIRERDGMVGLNFAGCFLREDGQMVDDVPLEIMRRHLDYLIERVGEERVGLGSDFDGAIVPKEIGDVSGLPRLRMHLAENGYDAPLLDKLWNSNWRGLIGRVIG